MPVGHDPNEPVATSFIDLLAQSVIVQGLVTLALVGAVIFMNVRGLQTSGELSSAMMLALGFYFGSKSQQVINASRNR